MTGEKWKIAVDPNLGEPLVEQLHRQFTWLIASGQLKPGDFLPSIRRLAQQLSINMLTVRSAYQRLEADGLVHTRPGSGTQVLELNPGRLVELAGRTRTYTIGVILPGLSNPFYHAFLQGVEEVVNQEQLMLFVCNAHEDPGLSLRYFAQLSARNVDGILFASNNLWASLGQPTSASFPVVNVDTPGCAGPVLNFDLEEAGYQAVRHLLSHGHRRIGQISFSERSANVLPVEAGYARALREAGIAPDESLTVRVHGFDMPDGESGTQQLLALGEPPTAIFTIADMLALGAMKALRKAGFHLPEQMALASVDDITLADLVVPGLTTVSLPARQLGVEAMTMLQNMIEGKDLDEQQITLPTRLVIRQSCGCH
jgi:LacI family transcriptional regulator, repressor for deo operon, udp, cdd, tsx, nupC, and nupG